ncbi:hypothetical protein VCSRO3_2943 [Vibrio cholerae]|nr:hypothetical protein VCSRO3_2943 [Vibrio cholerae]
MIAVPLLTLIGGAVELLVAYQLFILSYEHQELGREAVVEC